MYGLRATWRGFSYPKGTKFAKLALKLGLLHGVLSLLADMLCYSITRYPLYSFS